MPDGDDTWGLAEPAPPQPQPEPRQRRSFPCLVWLLFWAPLLTYVIAHSAYVTAHKIFAKRVAGQPSNPAIAAVQQARAVAGLVATVLVLGIDETTDFYLGIRLNNLFLLPVVVLLGGPMIVAVFIRRVPPNRRALLRRRLPEPLTCAAQYVVILTLVIVFLVLYESGTLTRGEGLTRALLEIAAPAGVVWLLFLWLFASFYSGRTFFGICAVHSALPAVLTIVMVWAMAVLGLVIYGPGGGPEWWQVASRIGGPASATAVALWELRWLRTRCNVRIRA